MKLTYDFQLEDWTAFQRYHFSASPSYRRIRNLTRIFLPAALLLLFLIRFLRHGFDPILFTICAVPAAIWFLSYPRWFDHRVIRRSLQMLREGNTATMFGRRDLELLPDRLHIVSPMGETTFRAAAISKIVESPEALLLYVSPVQAVILPKQKLSATDFAQAKEFVHQHYSQETPRFST